MAVTPLIVLLYFHKTVFTDFYFFTGNIYGVELMAEENLRENIIIDTGDRPEPGKAWVKGGEVFVKNPKGGGRKATVTACEGVLLLVNGEKVEGTVEVGEEDRIEVKPLAVEEPGSYKIRIGPGGLSAVLEVRLNTTTVYELEDTPPATDLFLKAACRVERSCPFDYDSLLRELSARNINYGVFYDEIQNVLSKPEDGLYLIAKGDPPGDPVSERVEFFFSAGKDKVSREASGDRLDFRDMVEIASVEAGALLAVKHAASQGRPGKKVTGEIIPPPQPQRLELAGGKGVEISPDGTKAFAKIGGRPLVRKTGNRYLLDIDPVLHVKGDVDISTGNVRFKGDVLIYGNVLEGMTVQSSGKVRIKGMVYQARVAALEEVVVAQHVTGSVLVAGGSESLLEALCAYLTQLESDLSGILAIMPELCRHPKAKEVKAGQLIQVLVDRKYPRFPSLIADIAKLVSQNSFALPRESVDVLEEVENGLGGLGLMKIESFETVAGFLEKIRGVQQVIGRMACSKANIAVGYATNSRLEATGDVRVEGKGCLNTVIRAGGNVVVKGVFRGGEVVARGDVILNEGGSELGVKTLIAAGDRRKIYIKKAYNGVTVQIGTRKVNITADCENVKVELDEDGYVVIRY